MARDDSSLPKRYQVPLVRLAIELVDQSAFQETASADERLIITSLMNDGYDDAVRNNRIGPSFAMQLLAAWSLPSGWGSLKASLDEHPRLAGNASYVMGMRFRTKGDLNAARNAFENARRLADPDSLLARLCSGRIQELSN
jgi:hypothetical protein